MIDLEKAAQHKNSSIAETILAEIKNGTWVPGDRLPPERQLSKRFACTRTTLRSGLKQLEKQHIIERVAGSGTYITDKLQPQLSLKQIAIIVNVNSQDLTDDPHLSSAILGMQMSPLAKQCKLDFIKLTSGERFFEHIQKHDISLDDFDGLFFLSYFLNDKEARKLKQQKIKFVGIGPTATGLEKLSHVFIDKSDGIYLATIHLLDSGRRTPCLFINESKHDVQVDKCVSAFKQALSTHEITIDASYIQEFPYRDHARAYQTMASLIHSHSGVDSVLSFGGRLTYGACRAIQDAGLKIPDDISVVMYNDYSWASDLLAIPLTTVRPPYVQQAQKGLELLLRKIDTDDNTFTIELLQPELCIRQSCGAALKGD